MSNPIIQTSFNAGEWAPALNARVDLEKYHSGAALLRNFFVDYRGGATTRPGTKYVLQCLSPLNVRLISFQASFAVTYVLEFGNGYIRFFNNGVPVLEGGQGITNVTQSNPATVTDVNHPFQNGDWVFISGVTGMTQLNGNYYIVINRTTNTYQLAQLYNSNIGINSTGFGAYTGGGIAQRVYTIGSPYLASELAQIKFVQNVNQMILLHPNHPPQVLQLNSATNWTITPAVFIPTIGSTGGVGVASTAAAGSQAVAYVVTAVDVNGQESIPSAPGILSSRTLLGANWSNLINWGAVSGAVSYNVYRSTISAFNAIPTGSQFGFVGNVTGIQFTDTVISPDFSQGPPILQNPFAGSGVQSLAILNNGFGSSSSVPAVTIDAPPPGGVQAQAFATCSIQPTSVAASNIGLSYQPGDILTSDQGGVVIQVTSVTGIPFHGVASFNVINNGSIPFPSSLPGVMNFTGGTGHGFTASGNWGVTTLNLTNPGSGYSATPGVHFSVGSAVASATLGAASAGNPTVPAFFQQRLILAGQVGSPSQMNFSQPGAPFNFNVSFPVQADDAIQQTLTNTSLNSIKSMVPVSSGLIVLSDKGAWLINGGASGAPISALALVANSQGYSGAADLPPIVTPSDILYVQSKGSIVRDLSYNFYLNNYVGVDISILSSHLFYGYTLKEWTWAEEPFKTVWAVRSDGVLLSLCFVKDQQMIAWAHHDSQGSFQSITSVTEPTAIGNVDAVYHVVQRSVQGQTLNYIERFVELTYPSDYASSWQVDAGIGYNGPPATTFSGAAHLGGAVVTGVADGVVINFTMPTSGTFVFGPGGTPGLTGIANASIVTVGFAFTPQIQTLALDLGGEATVQSKRKRVSAVTVRCRQALGLSAGRTFNSLVPMKDLIIGNVGTMSNSLVTGLQTTDARTIVDPQWDVFGQFCIQQSQPYPASILGVIPEIEVGDSSK